MNIFRKFWGLRNFFENFFGGSTTIDSGLLKNALIHIPWEKWISLTEIFLSLFQIAMVVAMIEKLLKQGEEILITASKEGQVIAQKVIARGQEYIIKGQQLIKVVAADLEKRLVPIKAIVDEIVKISKPVVEKFVQLAKDLKLRGNNNG